jgi:hypothetical protein
LKRRLTTLGEGFLLLRAVTTIVSIVAHNYFTAFLISPEVILIRQDRPQQSCRSSTQRKITRKEGSR